MPTNIRGRFFSGSPSKLDGPIIPIATAETKGQMVKQSFLGNFPKNIGKVIAAIKYGPESTAK